MLGRAGQDCVLRKEAKDAKAPTEQLQKARGAAERAVGLTRAWVRRKDASVDLRRALLLCAQARTVRTATSRPSNKGIGLQRLCLTSPAPVPSLQETSTFLSLESLPPSQPERALTPILPRCELFQVHQTFASMDWEALLPF